MKNKDKIKRKAGVVLVVLLMITISISSVLGGTVTNTDVKTTTTDTSLEINYSGGWIHVVNMTLETDDQLTRIVNSNGKSWPVTEANLATAIADVVDDGWVTVGDDLTITAAIVIDGRDNFILDFGNHVVTLNGNIEFINITDCLNFKLMNVVVKVNSGTAQTGNIIALYSDSWANRVDFCKIDNVYIDNAGGRLEDTATSIDYYIEHNYTGISLFADGVTADRVDSCVFSDIVMEGVGTGIYLYISGSSYINGNRFTDIYLDEFETGVLMVGDGISENVFDNLKIQCNPITLYGLRINGGDNIFDYLLVWDYNTATVCPDAIYQIWFEDDSSRCVVNAHAVANTNTYIDDFMDEGIYNNVKSVTTGSLDYDADYDYKFRVDEGTGYYYIRQGEHGSYAGGGSLDRDTDFEKLMEVLCDYDDIIIKFENGSFIPDDSVSVDAKNITFEGRDDHTSIIKCDAASYGSGLFTMNGVGDSNITFRNLVFDGTDATDTSVALYFGTSENTHGLTVENCIFINWVAGTSIAIYSRPASDDIVTNVKIVDCEFFNCDYGIFFDGDNDPSIIQYADVSHNYFQECEFSIFLDWVRNSSISNNRIISTVGGSDGVTLDNCMDVEVNDNVIIVADKGVIELNDADFNSIYNNNLRHCGTPLTTAGGDTTTITPSLINQWTLAYTHIGDPWFNASASHGITSTNLLEWALAYNWIGDQFFNASDAYPLQASWMAAWNLTNIFDQDLNESDDVIFNKVSTPNIDTASGGLNITSDDSYTRVTGDLNVTGTLSPTLFLIPCYGTPPATVSGMMYFNTGNNSLVVYYDGAWHYHEED